MPVLSRQQHGMQIFCPVMMMRMKMVPLLLTALCLLHPASAEQSVVVAPQDVRFRSLNLKNMLHWVPGRGAPRETTYTVEFAIYGDAVGTSEQVAWSRVDHCHEITATECDLSEQTFDIMDEYYARVRANGPHDHSHWVETKSRFRPMSDVVLGAPNVKVTVVENYMHIKVKGPHRWKSSRMKKGLSLSKVYPHMVYNISVFNNRTKLMQHFLLQNDSLRLGPLEYESQHCVMAKLHPLTLLLTSVHSDWSCIAIPSDPFKAQLPVLIWGCFLPTAICLFALAAVGGFAYYYIFGHKQKPPKSTQIVQMGEKFKMFQPEKPLTIINLTLVNTNLSTGESNIRPLSNLNHGISENECLLPIRALPPGSVGEPGDSSPEGVIVPSYAAQRVHPQGESDTISNAGLDVWSSQDSLSEDYGRVVHEPIQQDTQGKVADLVVPAEQPSEYKVNQYMAQSGGKETQEKAGEKEVGTFLDWDPQTGVLNIPLLCNLSIKDTADTKTETVIETRVDKELLMRKPILTSVVIRQTSEEGREEDIFTKMEKHWGLQIQSNSE